jgi:hypothetical protein
MMREILEAERKRMQSLYGIRQLAVSINFSSDCQFRAVQTVETVVIDTDLS